MSSPTIVRAFVVAAAFAACSSIDAQPKPNIQAEGYVVPLGITACLQGSHLVIDPCTGLSTHVQSSTLQLDPLICRLVTVEGPDVGVTCTVIDVESVTGWPQTCPADCDGDGLDDGCSVEFGIVPDCNNNGRPDDCDIRSGGSLDLNNDGIPDECQGGGTIFEDGRIMVSIPDPRRVTWDPERAFNIFNLYRGDLEVLRATGLYTQNPVIVPLAGQVCHRPAVLLEEEIQLQPGQTAYYIVAGNRLGIEGDLGADSDGTPRLNANACPSPPVLDVSVETDRALYLLGEPIPIRITLRNLSTFEIIHLSFPSSCQVTFAVEDLFGSRLYDYLQHVVCLAVITSLVLNPGESRTFSITWNQVDDLGNPVPTPSDLVIRGLIVDHEGLSQGITGISILS